MSQTWMDVTTILGWGRHAVGIIRTEAECASYMLKLTATDSNYKFCSFDPRIGYVEVPAQNVVSALNRIGGKNESRPISTPAGLPQRKGSKVRHVGTKVLDSLPRVIRSHLYLYLQRRRDPLIAGYHALRSLASASRQLARPARGFPRVVNQEVASGNTTLLHPFNVGDTYISMGLDWDQKDFTTLYKFKKMASLNVVLFCYDVIPVTHPHLCVGDVSAKFANYFSKVAWCADTVLCISECSKRDLLKLLTELGTPIPRMEVIKLGCQLATASTEHLNSDIKKLRDRKFILFVSTIERRKNHEVLYRAYTRLIDKGVRDLPALVFVGMPGWGVSDLLSDLRLDPRTQNDIVMLNNIDDQGLVWLYQNCWFTVFPSLYEGWGLPVVESLAAGKFCLASSAASIPEAGGDLVEYLDPWNVEAWAEKLGLYLKNPRLIEDAETRIADNYRITSWHDTARSVFSAVGTPVSR